jgi:hypothetical protein
VERVKGNYEVEFVVEEEMAGIGDLERNVGTIFVPARVRDHVVRGIDAEDATMGKTCSKFGGDAAIAAADVQHALGPVELEKRQRFFGHGFLKAGAPYVRRRVPFGHEKSVTGKWLNSGKKTL